MSKLKDLEQRLQRTEQQLRLFQKVSRFMVREMSLQEILQGVVSLIVEFMECDSCLVYLIDQDELVLCASNTPTLPPLASSASASMKVSRAG